MIFLEEKVHNEAVVMRYVCEHTTILVPFILHWGTKEESPLGLGPFIIMEYIEHEMNMCDALNTPGFDIWDCPILDPNTNEHKLETLFEQLADILLQLSTLTMPKTGSLNQIDNFTWEVTQRPLTLGMNELVRLGTLPRSKLPKPGATFETASSYFNFLADVHLDHFLHQRNDSIDDETDYRRKYVARKLFRTLTSESRFTSQTTDAGTSPLWCDDLRPANILIDKD